MSGALNTLLLRLGRWPRRFAVLVCVVLGLSQAVQSHDPGAARDPLVQLADGQVAVPVTLDQGGTDALLRVGQRVGLMASARSSGTGPETPEATLVGDHLLLLRVSGAPPGGIGKSSIVVAADRATALRIAGASGQTILAVLDKSP